jgi:hypothetical protein
MLALATFAHAEPANGPGPRGSRPTVERQGIRCEPRKATRDDTIVIHLPTPHGGALVIEDPEGGRFGISFDRTGSYQPLLQPETFRSMNQLSIKINEAMGYTAWERERIFKSPGVYKVLVGELQTTPAKLVIEDWCLINLGSVAEHLECEPREVTPRDTLKIRLPIPHSESLVIDNPRKKWFKLTDAGEPVGLPLIPSTTFRSMTELSLKVGEAKGLTAEGDASVIDSIFRSPGTYTVRLRRQENIMNDEDRPWVEDMCTVKFRR